MSRETVAVVYAGAKHTNTLGG